MKKGKKSKKDELVTVVYLDKRLGIMQRAIDKRFGLMESAINRRFDRLFTYLDYRLEPLEESKREFKDFKDSVLKSLDFLVGAYKKFEDEYTVGFKQYSRLDGKLEDHEVRIKLLENKRRKKPS